jgi:Zn-dependent membrane protease YugP
LRVKGTFGRYADVRTARNISGARVARELLDLHGLQDVTVERSAGELSDHYDALTRSVRLSDAVFDSHSIVAAGVAAQEIGHALQAQSNRFTARLHDLVVPIVRYGSLLALFVFVVGVVWSVWPGDDSATGLAVATGGLLSFAMLVWLALLTLSAEFSASQQVRERLASDDVLYQADMQGVNAVMKASSWIYVATALQAMLVVTNLFASRRDGS